jgi:hypothetical protein
VFELDDARRDELIETWAHKLSAHGLGAAAVFLLEAHKPLAGLGAQAITAVEPMLAALVPIHVGELAAFMHRAENIERLVVRIEQLERIRQEERESAGCRRAEVRRRARRIRRLRAQRQQLTKRGSARGGAA